MTSIPVWWIEEWANSLYEDETIFNMPVDTYCDGYVQNVIDCLLTSWLRRNHPKDKPYWIYDDGDLVCSECHVGVVKWTITDRPKYCPNCGAKMDEEGS